jgi:glycosyltransferase involved in cell wall biosynthesis
MMANLTQAVHEQRPDLIVVSSLDLHRYLYELRAVTSSPLVLDMHNIESLLFRDISQDTMHRYESDGRRLDAYWRKVAAVERDAVHFSHQIWTCSDRDAERLVELYDIPRSKIKTVPNAVSVKSVITASVPVRLLFPGRLDWYPNATAAELLMDQVAPLLADRMPSFPLVLAGSLPRPGSLTGRILNRQTPSNVRIVADPEDMSDLWPRAILIVPLRLGGGTRLKILQAFAAGSPVISTAKGIEGIAAEHGIHYVNAEEPAEMVNATCRLLDNRGLREEMVTEAHNLVARQYSVDALARLIRTILRENLRHDFQ